MKTASPWLAALVFAALAFGPVAHADDPAPPKPDHALAVEPLRIDTGHGPVRFRVEIAADARTRDYGLMFRRHMRDDRGMIFDFVQPQPTAFWMENTLIPLDMLFVGADGRIISVARQAKPLDKTPIDSGGPVRAVIEINGGLADRLGIRVGDRVVDRSVFPHG